MEDPSLWHLKPKESLPSTSSLGHGVLTTATEEQLTYCPRKSVWGRGCLPSYLSWTLLSDIPQIKSHSYCSFQPHSSPPKKPFLAIWYDGAPFGLFSAPSLYSLYVTEMGRDCFSNISLENQSVESKIQVLWLLSQDSLSSPSVVRVVDHISWPTGKENTQHCRVFSILEYKALEKPSRL